MRSIKEVLRQLNYLGVKNKFLIWPEIKQLPGILFEDEVIHQFVKGGRPSGFACLIATDRRVILVQKVFFGLIVEDVPYDAIHSVRFNSGILFGRIDIQMMENIISMRRIYNGRISNFTKFVQFKIQQAQRIRQTALGFDQMNFLARRPSPQS